MKPFQLKQRYGGCVNLLWGQGLFSVYTLMEREERQLVTGMESKVWSLHSENSCWQILKDQQP